MVLRLVATIVQNSVNELFSSVVAARALQAAIERQMWNVIQSPDENLLDALSGSDLGFLAGPTQYHDASEAGGNTKNFGEST